jgi:serine/threonine-protein kinase
VLELIEGPTLADRIAQGPVPVDETLPIATQIAEALEAAHEAGVIHRDLKPANIKVRDDGTVKVLDFGLAKALDPNPEGDPSQSPTLTAAATQMGVIMGTAAYMSPEQARGRTVDRRADIWAFGAVFYEMLTGRRAFEGEDVSLTLSAVLQREPSWDALPAETPSAVTTFLKSCFMKDARQRARDIGDVRLALEGAFDSADDAGPRRESRAAAPRAAIAAPWRPPRATTTRCPGAPGRSGADGPHRQTPGSRL